MGGRGSGRRQSYSFNTVDNCRILDASRWMRDGTLVSGGGTWQWRNAATDEVLSSLRYRVETDGCERTVHLTYTLVETGEQLNYAIHMQTTTPNRGGQRWWFTCPLVVNGKPCGRRVQKLYLPLQAKYYGCRHCYQLGYDSRNQNEKRRAVLKAQRIRRRLGGSPSLYDPFPEKPHGMWWRTYHKLKERAEQAERKYWARGNT
jgi:hypothetical protein